PNETNQEVDLQKDKPGELMPPPACNKRAFSDTVSNSSETTDSKEIRKKPDRVKTVPKKIKNNPASESNVDEIVALLAPAEDVITSTNQSHQLDIKNIANLLHTSFGQHDVRTIALNYTQDLKALAVTLAEISSRLSTQPRSLKSYSLFPFTMDKEQPTKPITLKLMFWNTRSVSQRLEEIQLILNKIDILVCVESWLSPDINISRFPGFVPLRRDRTQSRGGGILILIRKNMAFSEIRNLSSPDESVELSGIHLNHLNPPLSLIACYRTPGQTLTQDQWDNIVINGAKNGNCIFMGDFNAHNIIWNCKYTDSNGIRLANSVDTHDFFLHNDNSFTHIDMYRNSKSNLDLIFSSINISDKINVEVLDDAMGSDHFPLFITYNTVKSYYTKQSFKLKSVRTRWDEFEQILETSYPKVFAADYVQLEPHC
ncbi:hypothetical protein KPH14_012943, partial [Odynerus spinipes]